MRYTRGWMVALLVIALFALMGNSAAQARSPHTKTIWLQTMDSCQQAIPGAGYVLFKANFHGAPSFSGVGPGTKPVTVQSTHGHCPLQRGDCVNVPTGCVSLNIRVPRHGTLTYYIIEVITPTNYAPCTGGSACHGEEVTLTVDASGDVAAWVTNMYPDHTTVTWPTTGAPYTGAKGDPIVAHNFELGNGSCDGDNDADDHLTGTPSSHCDDDGD